MGAAYDGEAESPLRLRLDGLAGAGTAGFRLLRPDLSELLGVGEDEVHVLPSTCQRSLALFLFPNRVTMPYLIERQHLPRHLPPVDEGDPHPPVDLGHIPN